MDDMPVEMKSRGYSLAMGLMADPFTARRTPPSTGPHPSLGSPSPEKVRPRSDGDREISSSRPRKRTAVEDGASPSVPEKTCTRVEFRSTRTTLPLRTPPSGESTSTISS